jgi:hypothetical protein
MPNFKADLKAAQDNPSARQRVDSGLSNMENRIFESPYTTLGTEVANDTIDFFDLPIGAIFIPEETRIVTDGVGGTGVTFSKLGDPLVDNRYWATAIPLTAAGVNVMAGLGANLLARYKVAAGGQSIRGTLAGTFPMTAGKKIVMHGKYRFPS